MPPLVVEVLSPGNRKMQIEAKIAAYLDSGAEELIVVARNGRCTFHRTDGAHRESAMGVTLDLPSELFT